MGLPGLMTTKARTFLPEARSAATDCFRASICSHEVSHHNHVSRILVARIEYKDADIRSGPSCQSLPGSSCHRSLQTRR